MTEEKIGRPAKLLRAVSPPRIATRDALICQHTESIYQKYAKYIIISVIYKLQLLGILAQNKTLSKDEHETWT